MSGIDHERCVSEEVFESRLIQSMFAHQAAAYEGMVTYLLERAGLMFAQGKDGVANFLRDDLVPELRRRAVGLRKKQAEESQRILGQKEEEGE